MRLSLLGFLLLVSPAVSAALIAATGNGPMIVAIHLLSAVVILLAIGTSNVTLTITMPKPLPSIVGWWKPGMLLPEM